jgi:hypothetical protein
MRLRVALFALLPFAFATLARGDGQVARRGRGVAYGQGGYRFKVLGVGEGVRGYERVDFDDSGWDIAKPGGLGSGKTFVRDGRAEANPCALQGDGWPADSDVLVRQRIDVPVGAHTVEIGLAFDNDLVEVWWNGVPIAPYRQHENCATHDTEVLTVHDVRPGPNVLAVRVRDRGVVSYYDHRITVIQ